MVMCFLSLVAYPMCCLFQYTMQFCFFVGGDAFIAPRLFGGTTNLRADKGIGPYIFSFLSQRAHRLMGISIID